MTPDDLDALIDRMRQPGPIDDSPGGYDREGMPSEQTSAREGDRAADRYDEWMNR